MTEVTVDMRRSTRAALLLVDLADIRCAFPLEHIAEVLPAARISPLPGAPEAVAGVVNVRGEPIVVVDGHRCVDRAAPPLIPTDRFVVLNGREPRLAIRVDDACDVRELGDDDRVSEVGLGANDRVRQTIAVLPDGVLVIRDPSAFVTASDARAIRRALEQMREQHA